MTAADGGGPAGGGKQTGGRGRLALALGTITLVQLGATLAILTPATLAPAIARDLGIEPEAIGYQIAVSYAAAAVISSLAGDLLSRHGPGRASQLAMGLAALGMLLIGTAHWLGPGAGLVVFGFSALVMGLGYGLTNPASSLLLLNATTAGNRNLLFSLKQTGVPIAGVLAGLLLPLVTERWGWPAAAWLVALLCLLFGALVEPWRKEWDVGRRPRHRVSLRAPGIALVLRHPPLRGLSLAAFCLAAVQLTFVGYLVNLLVHAFALDLVAAGSIAAVVQAAGAIGRLIWGNLADRMSRRGGRSLAMLRILAAMNLAGCLAVAACTFGGAPLWLAAPILVALGAAAIGWNGVFLAEVALKAPPGQIGAATGGALALTFIGVVCGPALSAGLFPLIGGYGGVFLVMALFSALAFVALRERPAAA